MRDFINSKMFETIFWTVFIGSIIIRFLGEIL